MVKMLLKHEDIAITVTAWHGCVPFRHAEGFANPRQTGVEHAEATPGNLGAYVRRETQDEWEHFFLATYRNDLEAVKAFAGEQYQIAVTYPDDEQFELLSIRMFSSTTFRPCPLCRYLLAADALLLRGTLDLADCFSWKPLNDEKMGLRGRWQRQSGCTQQPD